MRASISRFNSFYLEFKKTEIWRQLLLLRENSPEHQEENVAQHTRMTIDWYLQNLSSNRSDSQVLLTCLACLFHDTGKPLEVWHAKNSQAAHANYATHEFFSLSIWNNYATQNMGSLRDGLRLSTTDISRISFIIAHHELSNLESADAEILKKSLPSYIDTATERAWLDTILSDQHGRYTQMSNKRFDQLDQCLHAWSN
jgi:hypothetical protein